MSKLIDKIQGLAVEDDGCWVWQGAVQSSGAPVMKFNGSVSTVRRLIVLARGLAIPASKVATYTCHNKLCVHPNHTAMRDKGAVIKRGHKEKDEGHRLALNHKRALSKRKGAKLDMDKAREIRASSESTAELARKYGVTKYCVWQVRRGESWKEYGAANPFAALVQCAHK